MKRGIKNLVFARKSEARTSSQAFRFPFNRGLRVAILVPLVVAALVCSFATSALAQGQASGDAAPKKGPKYFGLRFNEDWSYLDGSTDSYEPDFFDRIKNINLGGDWRLDFGGSIRFRGMSETNKRYGGGRTSQDTYLLQQYLLHANLRYQDVFRFFIEGIHASVDERQTPALGIDENFYDIHQAFIDVKPFGTGTPLTVRVGRHELLFGKQ